MARKIVIFSTKGGVGRTFIATNLAAALVKEEQKKVLLVDLDMQAVGDMSRILNLTPHKAMVDLINLLKKQPKEFNKDEFLTHSPIGVDLLCGVLRPQQSVHMDVEKIKEIFALWEKDYDYIIMDAGKNFSDVMIAALNQANLILLVVTPDILSIYQTKWALDTLQFLHFPLAMVKVVLNRAESVASISWQEVRVSLASDLIALLPSEGRIVGQAINRCIPVTMESPKAKISLGIKNLLRQ